MEKATELKPDLVMLDLIMSKRDSLSAGREIRPVFPETAIILFTMAASSLLEIEAKSAGLQAVVSEMDGDALVAAIRAALSSSVSNLDGAEERRSGTESVPQKECVPLELLAGRN